MAILTLLDRHRGLVNDQIQRALFEQIPTSTGKPRGARGGEFAANRALRELFDGGWVDRLPVWLPRNFTNEEYDRGYLNVLTTQGFNTLQAHLARTDPEKTLRMGVNTATKPRLNTKLLPRASRPFIHPYGINDFAIRALAACQPEPWQFWDWHDDRQLAGLKKAGVGFTNIPDGFFVITNRQRDQDFAQFLEIDLGTETVESGDTVDDWRSKILGYGDYIPTHYDRDWEGLPRPIVLTVTPSEDRLGNLLRATDAASGGGAYWYTTFERLRRDGFWGHIWSVIRSPERRSLRVRCGG